MISMKRVRRLLTVVLSCLMVAGTASAESPLRPWTPSDSVAVRYFSWNLQDPWSPAGDDYQPRIELSADGRSFFFIVHHGELLDDAQVYELRVYDVGELHRLLDRAGKAPAVAQPRWKVEFRSFANSTSGIGDVRWQPDGTGVLFKGITRTGTYRAYRLDMKSGRVQALTDEKVDVLDFHFGGGSVIYRRIHPRVPQEAPYPLEFLPRRPDGKPAGETFRRAADRFTVEVARSGERARTLAGVRVSGAWFSPDGQKVVLSAVSDAPLGVRPGPLKFLLFDLQRDGLFPRAEILAGAGEASRAPAAIWSADGSTAILVNAKLPGANEGVLAQMLAATGELKVLEPMAGQTAAGMQSVSDVLLMGKDELHVMHESGGKPVARTVYSLRNGEWTGQPGALSVGRRDPRQLSGLEALVRQSVNDPSIAYVVRGKQELALIEPDPALQGVSRARMQKFEWQEPNGARMSGGLYLPRDVKLGKPVPLVIQDHTFNQKTFLPDGPYTHSDAAQTLVAQGMAVLQMGTDYNLPVEKLGSEGAELVARIDIVVEKLAAQGIIDPQRVGVTGYSRGGYRTYYAITHPGRTRLAAVVCADSFTGDYVWYLYAQAFGGWPEFDILAGGSFWERKAAWLERETSFNVDRVNTPALFTSGKSGTEDPMTSVSTIGAFARNGKAFDYVYIPHGSHPLRRPRQQFATMGLVVDWLNFWLKDQAPPDEELAARWSAIRSQWEKSRVPANR